MKRTKEDIRTRIHRRIRKRMNGTADRPRLAIFRSEAHIYAQVIDDVAGKTIVAALGAGIARVGARVTSHSARVARLGFTVDAGQSSRHARRTERETRRCCRHATRRQRWERRC